MKSKLATLIAAITFLAVLVIPVSRFARDYPRNDKRMQETGKLIEPGTLRALPPPLAPGGPRLARQALSSAGCNQRSKPSSGTLINFRYHCEVTESGGRYVLTGWCLNESTCTLTYADHSCPTGYPAAHHQYIRACRRADDPDFSCFF